jgi:hypothetical protein
LIDLIIPLRESGQTKKIISVASVDSSDPELSRRGMGERTESPEGIAQYLVFMQQYHNRQINV